MPRVVIGVLAVLALVAFAIRALGGLDLGAFTLGGMVASLLVLLISSVGSSWLLGAVFRSQPSMESALISGLLLWFIYWPTHELLMLAWLAGIAVLAQASKYLIAWRGRHLVNPVAAAIVISVSLSLAFEWESMPWSAWWVASEAMVPAALVGAVVVLWRLGHSWMVWLFFWTTITGTVIVVMDPGAWAMDFAEALGFALYSTPIVFFAGFMVTEPLTMPSRPFWQSFAGALAGILVILPLASGPLGFDVPGLLRIAPYELALVLTGIIAFLSGQTGRRLVLRERRSLGGDAEEYVFDVSRPLGFEPGQYVDLDIAHSRPDRRGRRRPMSPVSSPGSELVIATRHPADGSTYKNALAAMVPGDRARVTSVHGDFVWPRRGPILLIGAGIGVTPFLSQIAAHPDRDVVLILGERPEGQPYAAELSDGRVRTIVLPVDDVTVEAIAEHVPDLKTRTALISGRPEFVVPLARGLRGTTARVASDVFWGY